MRSQVVCTPAWLDESGFLSDKRCKNKKTKQNNKSLQSTNKETNSFIFPISEQLLHPLLHPDPAHPPIHTLQRGLQHPTSQDIKMDLWPGSILSKPTPPPLEQFTSLRKNRRMKSYWSTALPLNIHFITSAPASPLIKMSNSSFLDVGTLIWDYSCFLSAIVSFFFRFRQLGRRGPVQDVQNVRGRKPKLTKREDTWVCANYFQKITQSVTKQCSADRVGPDSIRCRTIPCLDHYGSMKDQYLNDSGWKKGALCLTKTDDQTLNRKQLLWRPE